MTNKKVTTMRLTLEREEWVMIEWLCGYGLGQLCRDAINKDTPMARESLVAAQKLAYAMRNNGARKSPLAGNTKKAKP